jgi:hypothetical protein
MTRRWVALGMGLLTGGGRVPRVPVLYLAQLALSVAQGRAEASGAVVG